MSPEPKNILPKIVLGDADTHRVAAPHKRFRIIGGAKSNYREEHFETQEERDQAAADLADEFGEQVVCEFWSFANPHDDLNRGWACDGAIVPSQRKQVERCPACGHAPHDGVGFCPNMASDNDCSCTHGRAEQDLARMRAAGVLPMHEFVVTIAGCSREEAEQVLNERLSHDEDYGFDYEIGWRKA